MKNSLEGFAGRLMAGTALALLAASTAQAQNETVYVTGTTIRGQAPIGANVISVDRQAIEQTGAQTTQQLLSTIPQLNNFGSAAQGGQNASDGSGSQSPTIHSLGNSASNATLILIDGHRLPLTGLDHNTIDPSIIPTSALANVEVLPDGASAIYGSDAVAGVINFHLRKDYSGWESSVQFGIADHYNTFNASQLFGHSWENGGLIAAFNYSSRSNLMNANRDFITPRQDLRLGAMTAAQAAALFAVGTGMFGTVIPTLTASSTQPLPANTYPTGLIYPSLGTNTQNFTACPVAIIATSSNAATPGFTYPYSTTSVVSRQTSPSGPGLGICDTSKQYSSALPSEVREAGIVGIHQALNDKMVLSVDLVYSSRLGSSRGARGGTTAVAYSPFVGTGGPAFGSNQANPFYQTVPGATGAQRNSEFVSLDFTQMLADAGLPGSSTTKTGQTTAMATVNLDYDLGGDWLASFGGTVGVDTSFSRASGSVNTSEIFLALNGTRNSTGSGVTGTTSSAISDPYGLGTIVNVTRALNTSNALDVWNPSPNNRTSQSVWRSILDNTNNSTSVQSMQDFGIHFDGPLVDLPAGKVKAAFGAEFTHYAQNQPQTTSNSTGPTSTSSRFGKLDYHRVVYAVFAEFVFPVISADMGIPLIQKLDIDLAGRYDHYDLFGETRNPKISFNWDLFDGLRASGSFGTSFTAPALDSGGGGTPFGITGQSGVNNGGAGNLAGTSPTQPTLAGTVQFDSTLPYNAGAGIAGTFVTNPYACFAAGSTPVNSSNVAVTTAPFTGAVACSVQSGTANSAGLSLGSGGKPGLKPEIGQSYSANLLLDFGKFVDVLDGLTMQVTYYQAKFTGAVTTIGIQAGLPGLTTFAPANGCNAATFGITCGLSGVPSTLGNQPGWSSTESIVQDLALQAPLNVPFPNRVYSIFDGRQTNAFSLWENGLDFSVNYRLSTDSLGDFAFGLSGNQILRFSQQNGPGGPIVNIIDGNNSGRFSANELTARASVNWHLDPFSVGLAMNFQHPTNDTNSAFPWNLAGPAGTGSAQCPGFSRCAGWEHLGALVTYDLNASYDLPGDMLGGFTNGTSLNLSVNNVLDTPPPWFDSASGADGVGSAIGRVVNVSLRKKW